MKIRSAIFLAAFFCLSNIAFAGDYQKAQDGKTWVWNNDPAPGDQATWSGERDEKGYATGKGTLTWFRTQRKVVTGSQLPIPRYIAIASYTGEMVHGKLNGKVTAVDVNGKKFHGTYADGNRKKWTAGAAKEIAAAKEEPAVRRGELVEAPAEGPNEPPKPAAAEKTPSQSSATKPAPAATAKPGEFDDSLRSLVGPPTSLRKDADAGAGSPVAAERREAGTSSPAPEQPSSPAGASVAPSPQP